MRFDDIWDRFVDWLGSGSSYQVGLTLLLVVAVVVLRRQLTRFVRRQEQAGRLKRASAMLAERLTSFSAILLLVLGAAVIWSLGLENAWAAVAGVIGLVAIGFVAVWSVLSNLVAGLIILLTRPFRVDDHIEILPDGVGGRVFDINMMFMVLKADDGTEIVVPNNMVFQRVVRKRSPDAGR